MLTFLTVIRSKITWAIVAIAAGLIMFLRVKKMGATEEQVKHLEKTLDAIRTREEVRNEVERLPDGDAASRLRDNWSRD